MVENKFITKALVQKGRNNRSRREVTLTKGDEGEEGKTQRRVSVTMTYTLHRESLKAFVVFIPFLLLAFCNQNPPLLLQSTTIRFFSLLFLVSNLDVYSNSFLLIINSSGEVLYVTKAKQTSKDQ